MGYMNMACESKAGPKATVANFHMGAYSDKLNPGLKS